VPVFKGEVVALPTIDFRTAERAARPNRVARKIEQPVVERGWTGIQNGQDAQKARAKMEAEATPPPNLPAKRFVRPAEQAGRSNRTAPSASPIAARSPAPLHASPRPSPTAAPINSPEPTQPSPAESVPDSKQAGHRQDGARAAQEQKRKQRQEAQAQRRADREQQNAEKKQERQAAPGATATAPTESPTPVATASPAPATPAKQSAAEKRRAKRAERRAQRGQPQESPEPGQSATPNGQQP
jgi:hypothetical protein